jgi:hypothetical protein
MAIKLLAASVGIVPISKVSAAYTSFAPNNRLALANRTIARNSPSCLDDEFVWSASASEDGSFDFYAAQQTFEAVRASSPWNGSRSAHVSSSDWYTQNALFQYDLQASLQPGNRHSVDVYS